MTEIWLNYGVTDVVLDVRAENLGPNIGSGGEALGGEQIEEKLGGLNLKKPIELGVLHYSEAVAKAVSSLLGLCERKSAPAPRILADAETAAHLRRALPEVSQIGELGDGLGDSSLVFVAEMELDGLFGYETIATRLLRRFGQDNMLAAFAKRSGNMPAPGRPAPSIGEATTFADGFEVQGIELVAGQAGISDMQVGHPSKTASLSKSLEGAAVRDVGRHKSLIISTGKSASNDTLGRALNSLWACSAAVTPGGLAVLLAECASGLGSEAMRHYVEGRITVDSLRNPSRYIGGMEDLLFLTEVQKSFQIGLVSVLPQHYSKKLQMIPLDGAKPAMEYILRTQGPKQKVVIVSDGARLLLR